jgi:DNA-directed RNA polymerase specialized sigma24 family protein
LNPTWGQRQALARAFGCARVVFNDVVAARRSAHEAGEAFPTDAALSKALTAAKRTPERAWLGEVSAVVLQQALADANRAYRSFFASLKGERKGRRLGAPRFRSRRDRRQSIRFTKAARFRITSAGRLRIPGIGDVPVRWSREPASEPSSVTVTVDPTGRYHASFVVEVPDQPLPRSSSEVGVDLGLTHFAVLSDGTKVDAPRIARKAAAKLRTAQKELARRQKGSARREKARRKVARCHARVGATRRDWMHAEDAVQEVFLRAWRSWDKFDGTNVRAWLYKIATNTCVDLISGKRGALLAREVLGMTAQETADLLDISVPAANSALQRARATMRQHLPSHRNDWTAREPSPRERELLSRFIDAHQRCDAAAAVAVAAEDLRITMPPAPLCFEGVDQVAQLLARSFGPDREGDWLLVPTSANRMPSAASYLRRHGDTVFRAFKLDVLRVEGDRIAEITTFGPAMFDLFGLPATQIPGE